MKQITRNEASQLLRKFGVINIKIERSKNALLVYSMLSNNRSFLVKYDLKKHDKSYFVENEKNKELGDWMNKVEKAIKLFEDGFACAQAILSTYGAEFDLDKELALKIGDPFGAGMRGLSETCGAVTASFMVIGLKHGRIQADDVVAKDKTAELVQEFFKRFRDRHGAIICKELLGYDISIPEQHDIAEQQGFFRTKCPNFVRNAAEILEQIL